MDHSYAASLAEDSSEPPSAPSLQALMKSNPGILKTIQVNEPQQGQLSFGIHHVCEACVLRKHLAILELWSLHPPIDALSGQAWSDNIAANS